MNADESKLIADFIQRVGGTPAAGFTTGSVPSTVPATALPPIDKEADTLIATLFARYPEARYRITQMAFLQEHALAEAQNLITRLQWELQNAKAQAAPPQPAQPSPWGAAAQQAAPAPAPARGMFGGMFGGGQQAAPPPQQPQYAPQPQPQPQYAPGYQQGMFQPQGTGFLGSALRTAAGVAGGVVAGNMLMNMFSGGHGAAAAPGFGAPVANPWAAPAAPAVDPYDAGGQSKDFAQSGGGWSDPGQAQPTGWSDPGQAQPTGWSDPIAAPAADGWTTPQADSGWSTPDDSNSDFDTDNA